MSDTVNDPQAGQDQTGQDQDGEPSLTAPIDGRPDGSVAEPASDGLHAQDGPDQIGAEADPGEPEQHDGPHPHGVGAVGC